MLQCGFHRVSHRVMATALWLGEKPTLMRVSAWRGIAQRIQATALQSPRWNTEAYLRRPDFQIQENEASQKVTEGQLSITDRFHVRHSVLHWPGFPLSSFHPHSHPGKTAHNFVLQMKEKCEPGKG